MKVTLIQNLLAERGFLVLYPWPFLEIVKDNGYLMINAGWLSIYFTLVFDREEKKEE